MVQFTAKILQFNEQGEKTGWSYIRIPAAIATKLKPDNKRSFRVKGRLDNYEFNKVALLPMGEGDFIMPLKAAVRKAIGKNKGANLEVRMDEDKAVIRPPADLLECLADEPAAAERFKALPKSHQNYYGNWVKSAKTDATRAKRIAGIVRAMEKGWDFGQLLRTLKQEREDLAR
jgi:hypothetical protein